MCPGDAKSQVSSTTPTKNASSRSQAAGNDFAPESISGMPSRPAASRATDFFGLPKSVRHDIYQRLLVVKHPIYLFQDRGSRVETFAPDRPVQWLALLHTNRQLCSEARVVLYGMNRFVLVDTTQQQVSLLRSFLNCIGSINSKSMSYLCINFPVAENTEGQPRDVKIREDSLQSLSLVRDKCPGLEILETVIQTENSSFMTEADQNDPRFKCVQAALLRIDAQLKEIPSLKKIVVRVYIRNLPSLMADFMGELGWTVLFGDR